MIPHNFFLCDPHIQHTRPVLSSSHHLIISIELTMDEKSGKFHDVFDHVSKSSTSKINRINEIPSKDFLNFFFAIRFLLLSLSLRRPKTLPDAQQITPRQHKKKL